MFGTGGTGTALDLKAFLKEVSEALEPFFPARKPGAEPIEVFEVRREVFDPLLNLPNRGCSS
jgi:hypothetical protein